MPHIEQSTAEIDRRDLAHAEAVIVSIELIASRQSLAVDATRAAGGDPAPRLALLAFIEHGLAEMNARRDHLLAELGEGCL